MQLNQFVFRILNIAQSLQNFIETFISKKKNLRMKFMEKNQQLKFESESLFSQKKIMIYY